MSKTTSCQLRHVLKNICGSQQRTLSVGMDAVDRERFEILDGDAAAAGFYDRKGACSGALSDDFVIIVDCSAVRVQLTGTARPAVDRKAGETDHGSIRISRRDAVEAGAVAASCCSRFCRSGPLCRRSCGRLTSCSCGADSCHRRPEYNATTFDPCWRCRSPCLGNR